MPSSTRSATTRAAIAIAQATKIPPDRKSRTILRRGLGEALDYAWFVAGRQTAREQLGRSLSFKIRRIEKAARSLEAALADSDARYEVSRNLPVGELDATSTGLELLIDAASIATGQMKPRNQHRVHQVWFLTKVTKAIVAAGGRFPTYNKNSDGGSLRIVIDALREDLPPSFLNVSPSILASWTKKARLAAHK